jgi:hypothetical protein
MSFPARLSHPTRAQPGQTEEYEGLATVLWSDIRPQSTTQEPFASALIRTTRRLRRAPN